MARPRGGSFWGAAWWCAAGVAGRRGAAWPTLGGSRLARLLARLLGLFRPAQHRGASFGVDVDSPGRSVRSYDDEGTGALRGRSRPRSPLGAVRTRTVRRRTGPPPRSHRERTGVCTDAGCLARSARSERLSGRTTERTGMGRCSGFRSAHAAAVPAALSWQPAPRRDVPCQGELHVAGRAKPHRDLRHR